MEGPPLGPGGEDITWPDKVAPRGRKASSTRKIEPQTSNPKPWRRLLTAGGGAAWRSRPRGPAIGWGVAPFPRPPLPRAGPSCRPSLGPLIPPAVVARRWPARGGREG